jgi:hypothetical protein
MACPVAMLLMSIPPHLTSWLGRSRAPSERLNCCITFTTSSSFHPPFHPPAPLIANDSSTWRAAGQRRAPPWRPSATRAATARGCRSRTAPRGCCWASWRSRGTRRQQVGRATGTSSRSDCPDRCSCRRGLSWRLTFGGQLRDLAGAEQRAEDAHAATATAGGTQLRILREQSRVCWGHPRVE